MNLNEYAQYFLNQCNNDIAMAKKRISIDAEIALEEGDIEDFQDSTEIFQNLEVIASKLRKVS